MRGEIEVEKPDAVEVTLTITMTLGQWKELREHLPQRYPAWKLGSLIIDAVTKIEQSFAIPETKDL